MVDRICNYLTLCIQKQDSTIDEEKAEIINYGLQNLIGELPKGIIILLIACFLGIFELVLIETVVLLIYRGFAGGIHLKTHWSCLLTSTFFILGSTYLAKNIIFENPLLIYTVIFWINFILVTLYAPADTENRPIMKESQRKRQKIESYLTITIFYILCLVGVWSPVINNMIMYILLLESLMITPIAYRLAKNKSGEERRLEIQKSMQIS